MFKMCVGENVRLRKLNRQKACSKLIRKGAMLVELKGVVNPIENEYLSAYLQYSLVYTSRQCSGFDLSIIDSQHGQNHFSPDIFNLQCSLFFGVNQVVKIVSLLMQI
eukprot:TRINITY_DN95958_c0_g1_i1.p1 TRINITY_DN95958_c0_g1~~TRINITY_DN95958_c0_g1_i1.p1  ORF type:complete len:107 (-),score=1.47 TRINITY_DN95958_c0_g1_i1:27-347(-)